MEQKFVVITKYFKDIDQSKHDRYYPDTWPAQCEEFDSIEQAQAAYPDRKVYTAEQYRHFSDGYSFAEQYLPKRRWWHFWRKG